MKETDAAWLAGYIDGDGCICLSKRWSKSARSPELAADSCDIELLERVKALAGGYINKKSNRKVASHREGWHWRLHGSLQVVAVLKQLLPYLTCADKAARAKMLVEEWASCTPRNGCYTIAMLAAKDDFEKRFLSIGFRRGIRSRTTEPPLPSHNLVVLAQKLSRGPRSLRRGSGEAPRESHKL